MDNLMVDKELKIVCWNTDPVVIAHWQKVVSNQYEMNFVASLNETRAALSETVEPIAFCFIHLDDENFTSMVEHVVTVRNLFPELKIIAFPNQTSQSAALRMFSQGVNGQCAPFIGVEQLALVLSVVETGEIWGGKTFIENLINESARKASSAPNGQNRGQRRGDDKRLKNDEILSQLSQREMDVAKLVGQGLNNKKIAQDLDITDRTVKAHLTAIFKKLELKDRLSVALLVQNSSHHD